MIPKVSGFELSHADASDPVQRILDSALKQGGELVPTRPQDQLFWDAAYLGLDHVKLFQAADAATQHQILQIANQDLLEEIYWVEQAGVGYMSRMVLLAENCEERMLYSLFAADEATHLAQIQPFLGELPVFKGDSFLQFMASLIESPDKALLLALVQVVLEGWGLTHYRSLAKHCLDAQLTATLQGFLQAESRHHALGVTQLQQTTCSPETLQNLRAALTHFLQMVQVGPQRLVAAIAQVKGGLSKTETIQILEDLQTEVHSQTRLQLLRSLMSSAIPSTVMQALEDQGSFQPYPAYRCVV